MRVYLVFLKPNLKPHYIQLRKCIVKEHSTFDMSKDTSEEVVVVYNMSFSFFLLSLYYGGLLYPFRRISISVYFYVRRKLIKKPPRRIRAVKICNKSIASRFGTPF